MVSPGEPRVVADPLAFAGSVSDRVYTAGKAIPALVLPPAQGGTGPLTYTLAPLPPGLVFDGHPARRRLAGTPARPGWTTLTYTVTDAGGATAALAFRIGVEPDIAPRFDPGMVDSLKPQHYIAGDAVNLRLPVLTLGNGSNEEHRYGWTGENGRGGALPAGLLLERGDPASMAVTGTPTERMVSTEYTLTVTDRDGDTAALTLHIAVLAITEKPPGSEVTFDEETGHISVRNVRFPLEDGAGRTLEAARIELPAGQMVDGLALRVANLADDAAMPPDPGTRFGPVALDISPNGTLAGRAASICLSTDGMRPEKAPRLYHEGPASGAWGAHRHRDPRRSRPDLRGRAFVLEVRRWLRGGDPERSAPAGARARAGRVRAHGGRGCGYGARRPHGRCLAGRRGLRRHARGADGRPAWHGARGRRDEVPDGARTRDRGPQRRGPAWSWPRRAGPVGRSGGFGDPDLGPRDVHRDLLPVCPRSGG